MNKDNRNILFIVRTMGLGGTENVVLQLCEILSEHVNKIVVCSTGGVHEEILEKLGIKHYTVPDIADKNPQNIIKIFLKIKQIIKTEEITIIHSHHRMAALYAGVIADKAVIKLATVHNTFENKRSLTRFAYRNTRLIAVGEMVKKNLIDYFKIPDKQITVIHNAIKPFSNKIVCIDQLEADRKAGAVLIGNVGRLSEQKGMRYFIDAAEIVLNNHPESKFYIVGDGELKEQLAKRVKDKGLDEKICFLGYRSDIQNTMKQFDFIVLSSLWEGFPLTPIEAFSVGKTVIGTAVDGTPEIIKDGENGFLVNARDVKQLAEKIEVLIENPNLVAKFEENAKKSYQDEFSFEKLSKKYLDFYEEL